MGLRDIVGAINEWGRNERNDRAGVGKEWQTAQAAELARVLQKDEEERQLKRMEVLGRIEQAHAIRGEAEKQHRQQLLDKYGQRVTGLLRFDPKADQPYSMPDEDPNELSSYTAQGIDPRDLAELRARVAGEKNLSYAERRQLAAEKTAAEAEKDARELGQQRETARFGAGLAQGTHRANSEYDAAHPPAERPQRPTDYARAARDELRQQWLLKGGTGQPPPPEAILARAAQLKKADEMLQQFEFADKMRQQGDPLFAEEPTAPRAAPPATAGRPLPNGVTVRRVQ